jgi:hypothetical protein
MAIQWSAAVRNARLDAWETAIGTSAHLHMYTGSMPANVGAAATGNKIIDITLASDWAAAASNGSKVLNNLTISTTALTPGGTVGYYRIYASDNTTCHEQGTITATGGGGDMTVDNPTFATGQTVQITAFTKTEPGA